MSIFGFTRMDSAGIIESKTKEKTMQKTRIPKAPTPITPIITPSPEVAELVKRTKEWLIGAHIANSNIINEQARELAKVKTELAKLKFKAKQAKLKAAT